jgi:ADP-ribose pyrophosphatase YjhB (NUDIX family)
MKVGTVCFVLDGAGKILLALKKEGFGAGKWNGLGGKLKIGEDFKTTAAREIREESALIVRQVDLEEAGAVDFYFAGIAVFKVFIFLVRHYEGEPAETKEMKPQWFSIAGIPYHLMWAGDKKWLPLVLAGKRILAQVDYDQSGEKVEEFSCKEVE